MVMWMCVEVRWGCGLRGNPGNVDVCGGKMGMWFEG